MSSSSTGRGVAGRLWIRFTGEASSISETPSVSGAVRVWCVTYQAFVQECPSEVLHGSFLLLTLHSVIN